MRNKLLGLTLAAAACAWLSASDAGAQGLWRPTLSVRTPNMVVGMDTSVTLLINPSCQKHMCHARGLGGGSSRHWAQNTRLYRNQVALQGAMGRFQNDFVWGGFAYQGCGYAKVVSNPFVARTYPDINNVPASYLNTYNLLANGPAAPNIAPPWPGQGAGAWRFTCLNSESYLPGGSANTCLMPGGVGCPNDELKIRQLLAAAPPGLFPGADPASDIFPVAPTSTVCGLTGFSVFPPSGLPILDELAAQIVSASPNWPRWNGNPNPADITNFCVGLYFGLNTLKVQLATCLVNPDAWIDLSWLDPLPPGCTGPGACGGGGAGGGVGGAGGGLTVSSINEFCQFGTLQANICASGPMVTSCACDSNIAGCGAIGSGNSPCSVPYQFKARQQVAVCEANDPTSFRGVFAGQADNVVNGNCRQNVAVFLTDGYAGDVGGVIDEAARALSGRVGVPGQNTYTSNDAFPASNMFVFSSGGFGAGNTMMNYVSGGAVEPAIPANSIWNERITTGALPTVSPNDMKIAFARVLQQVLRSTYTGANTTFDRYQQRAAFHIGMVPGRKSPPTVLHNVDETYLGRPTRLAWWAVDPLTGAFIPSAPLCPGIGGGPAAGPLCETDWLSKAQAPSSLAGAGLLGFDAAKLGPGGNWDTLAAAVPKYQTIPPGTFYDRDGDGINDPHHELRFGYMFGDATTQVALMEGPRELPFGVAADDLNFYNYQNDLRLNRFRIAFTLSNGYLHAFYMGQPTAVTQTVGTVTVQTTYDETTGPCAIGTSPRARMCREIWRTRPRWANGPAVQFGAMPFGGEVPNYWENSLKQQDIISRGQIALRETRVGTAGTKFDFGTLLAATQGPGAGGILVMNVTNAGSQPAPMAGYPVGTVLVNGILPTVGLKGYASATPAIYQFPGPTAASVTNPMLVIPGGLGGPPVLWARRLGTGQPVYTGGAAIPMNSSSTLPAGEYPTAPTCVDALGKGKISHCYIVSTSGRVIRVRVNPVTGDLLNGGGADVTDITPTVGGSALDSLGLTFHTPPILYFDNSNRPTIFVASGNVNDIDNASAQVNGVFKIVDTNVAGATPATTINTCRPTGALADGVFYMPAGQHVVSPAVAEKGVIAWTSFEPDIVGCAAGSAYVYAMNFETCTNALTGAGIPVGVALPAQAGIPTSPTIFRAADAIVVNSSSRVGGTLATPPIAAQTRGLGKQQVLTKSYFRSVKANP